jgi:CDP-4-dehydro-6-deoxyglucose reductase
MKFEILLSNNKKFISEPDQTILDSAKKSNIVLEHSCINGQCGICSCKLVSGEVKQLDSIYSASSKVNSNIILTCQAIPITDIEIDIEDLGEYSKYPLKTIPVRISKISKIAKDILKLTFRTPPNNRILFLPGQYINLIHGSIKRSYSIANAARKNGTFDLIIKKVSEGVMSDILFNRTKENDLFRIEGPIGTFGWRAKYKSNVVFLVTGTGIAPVISIIDGNDLDKYNVTVIWGNRYENDFFELSKSFESVELIKVLSRDTASGYEKGYVQEVLNLMNIELNDTVIYACGSDAMIKSSQDLLISKGLDQRDFYSDSFLCTGK